MHQHFIHAADISYGKMWPCPRYVCPSTIQTMTGLRWAMCYLVYLIKISLQVISLPAGDTHCSWRMLGKSFLVELTMFYNLDNYKQINYVDAIKVFSQTLEVSIPFQRGCIFYHTVTLVMYVLLYSSTGSVVFTRN